MSDLQDALRRIPEDWNGSPEWRKPVLVLRAAARRVANLPDTDTMRRTIISAGIELQKQERNITWPEWANELLAALGITENTE